VGDGHTLYWQVCGSEQAPAAVILHGGPGGGSAPVQRRFFDPDVWRIVQFDQRGAGLSTPLGSVDHNTTAHLIRDMERLREHLGIQRWLLFGGSWGSTLALAYAQAHPNRVSGLVLRGIFLLTQQEIDWFLHGMQTIFPEAARRFRTHIPEDERDDLLEAYHRRLFSDDAPTIRAAARHWVQYEMACSSFRPLPGLVIADDDLPKAVAMARIECHYFRDERFAPEDLLLQGIDRIRHIPTIVVQGRYDVVCPMRTADRLHLAWPEADYVVVPDAGHSSLDGGMTRHLLAATERFKARGT